MAVAVFPLGPLQTNSYIIHNATRAVAVDVGGDPAPMLEYLKSHQLTLDAVCITHRHFDHMYGVAELADATGAPVHMPQGDDSLADTESGKGGIWGFPPVPDFKSSPMPLGKTSMGGMDCEVLETPGHTPAAFHCIFPKNRWSLRETPCFTAPSAARTFPAATMTHCCAPCGTCCSSSPPKLSLIPVTVPPPK